MPRYVRVVKGVLPARYLVARMVRARYSEEASTGDLLREHNHLLGEEARLMEMIDRGETIAPMPSMRHRSLLDLKALLGKRMLSNCHLCERRCHVDRTRRELGYCHLGEGMSVSSAFVHMGEEPEIVPSFTVCGP
jgi:putative pyruvate formate lyase activating enzyme